jgi:Ger(x)C family germination protein
MKRISNILLVFATAFLLSGCDVRELESRGFPLAIGIDQTDTGMILSFDFPDMTEVSNGKSPMGKEVSFSVEAGEYYEAQKAYENNTNRTLDYNHLKALILSQDFIRDTRALRELLTWFEKEEEFARNTCLFIAKDSCVKILSLSDKTEGSVGNYLEEMVESQDDYKSNKIMTMGKLMNQWHNQNELLLIPVLTDNGGYPTISEYAAIDNFVYKGNIAVGDSMFSFLTQGMLKSFTYRLGNGTVLEISNILRNFSIKDMDEEAKVTVTIKGDAHIKKENVTGQDTVRQTKQQADNQLAADLAETADHLSMSPGIDMTNSYIMLGGYNRKLYDRYLSRASQYAENVTQQFKVDLTLINE